MSWPVEVAVLLLTGTVAGVVSTVVSLASLVSFPMLIALGLAPVAANVTNTVALTFAALGAMAGSRPELMGLRRTVTRLSVLTAVGGGLGAAALLLSPAGWFTVVAPWLIATGAVVIMLQPRLGRRSAGRPPAATPRRLLAVTATSVYTGYFGAGGGVITLAVLSLILPLPIRRLNAVKNVIAGAANLTASLGFAVFGPVDVGASLPLAVGFLLGGWIGPGVARRLPGDSLRFVIGVAGLLVAIVMAVKAYS